MRKIFIVLLVIFFTGCFNRNNVDNNDENKDMEPVDNYNLEDKFKDDFYEIYGDILRSWSSDAETEVEKIYDPGTDVKNEIVIVLSLEDLRDVHKKDISMYINKETKNPCDYRNSYVICNLKRDNDKKNVDIEVVLSCND